MTAQKKIFTALLVGIASGFAAQVYAVSLPSRVELYTLGEEAEKACLNQSQVARAQQLVFSKVFLDFHLVSGKIIPGTSLQCRVLVGQEKEIFDYLFYSQFGVIRLQPSSGHVTITSRDLDSRDPLGGGLIPPDTTVELWIESEETRTWYQKAMGFKESFDVKETRRDPDDLEPQQAVSRGEHEDVVEAKDSEP